MAFSEKMNVTIFVKRKKKYEWDLRVCQRDIVNKLEVNFLCAFFLKTNLAGLKLDSSNYGEKWILKDISYFNTVELGDKELFGHPKIVP